MKLETPATPITAAEYHRLGEQGFFGPDERVELIEGEIIPMTPVGPDHLWSVNYIVELFMPLASRREAMVSVQNPIALDGLSEPEPDVALLVRPEKGVKKATPGARDVLLAIEVADSTLATDRDRKMPLYGSRGVLESWLVDLNAGTVTAYRKPSAKGYLEQKTFKRGDRLAPEAFPDFEVAVDDMLG
jgi:Uma2 family endonuclease